MVNQDTSCIPADLLRYLPDSEIQIISWDGIAGTLQARITKDIGPETGIVTFFGVSHVNLGSWLTSISGITCGKLNDLPRDYLDLYRPGDQALEPDDIAFLVHGSWGEEFFVIAKQIKYEVDG